MRILALESSAVAASACVMEDEKILSEFYMNTKQTHSQTLLPMAKAALDCAGLSVKEMDLLAVSAGPGSFTGVRIGVACIKGLAFPDNKSCCGVSTLEAMAMNLRGQQALVCAVMDARCGQVYNGLFLTGENRVQRLTEDRALSIEELAAELPTWMKEREIPLILVGDGARLCFESPCFAGISCALAPEHLRMQRASGVAEAARQAFLEGNTVSPERLAPIYLRLPQAQRELNKRLAQQKEQKV